MKITNAAEIAARNGCVEIILEHLIKAGVSLTILAAGAEEIGDEAVNVPAMGKAIEAIGAVMDLIAAATSYNPAALYLNDLEPAGNA